MPLLLGGRGLPDASELSGRMNFTFPVAWHQADNYTLLRNTNAGFIAGECRIVEEHAYWYNVNVNVCR